MLQISIIHLYLLPLACLVVTAKADGWDDFANNLATDLAPILALFGEQVTKQFLSESTTKLDNFIFAMAPLGILTAVVSAIRVCGGPSLRAFIGRAQEGGGMAEAELCSSTSRDVCELYHNGAIVRVFGRPKILEIVHDSKATIVNDEHSQTPPDCGIYSFQDYIKTKSARCAGWKEIGKSTGGDVESLQEKRARGEEQQPQNDVEAQQEPQQETNSDSDDDFAPNPNLSFNIGIQEQPIWVIQLAATAGFLMQAAVLVFGFLVTYTWGWTKDGAAPEAWAFPLMTLGTLLLGGGMFFCALLVENSTKERTFVKDPKKKDGPSIYVIQPGNQTIGDQTFDPFSFTDTSRRLKKYTTSWKVDKEVEIGVWLATGSSMLGFVLQFVGLRSMHSAVSVFQLGAILVMSIIRAMLRTQRLGKEQNLLHDRPDEVEGHELDWLALQMAKIEPKKEGEPKEGGEREKKDERRIFWSVIAGQATPSSSGTNAQQTSNIEYVKLCQAQRVFFYRSRLAELTSLVTRTKSRTSTAWGESLVHARQQARQLKRAVESSADILFAHAKMKPGPENAESIDWVVDVADYERASKLRLPLLRQKDGKQFTAWNINQHYLEAAIGLWTWSMISDPRTEVLEKRFWVSMASEVPASRIMAFGSTQNDIERARTDLELWIEGFAPATSTEQWKSSPGPLERGPHTLWEAVGETIRKWGAKTDSDQTRRFYGWQVAPHELLGDMFALTATVKNPISTACAHDFYQSFLFAIKTRFETVGGQTKLLEGSKGYYLTNDVISRLADCFREAGLGSIQDAYSVIIPALRSELPLLIDVLPTVHNAAEKSRKEGNFRKAEAILKWAWETVRKPNDDGDDDASDATMLELGELYRYALFQEDEPCRELGRNGISWMEKQTLTTNISARYANLRHKMSNQKPHNKPHAKDVIDAISVNDRPESLWLISQVKEVLFFDDNRRTILSWAAQCGWSEIVKAALEIGSAIDLEDKWGRTPLSYAAENGHAEIVEILMRSGALPITEDSSRRTPLSYAAARGCVSVTELLLNDRRVNALTKDKDERSPLHWAAKSGNLLVIQRLFQGGAERTLHNPDNREQTPLIVALLHGQTSAADFLIKQGAKFNIRIENTEAWRWAFQNGEWTCAVFLLRQFNQDNTERKAVTLQVFCPRKVNLTSNNDTTETEITVNAFDENGTKTAVTADTVRNIAQGRCTIAAELCTWGSGSCKREELKLRLDGPLKIIELLLDERGAEVKITEAVVEAAAGNGGWGEEVMKLLLDKRGAEVKITEAVVKAAAGNMASGEEVIKLLLNKRGAEVRITEAVVEVAAGNRRSGKRLIELLLDKRGAEVKVTKVVIEAAAGDRLQGEKVMKLLLDGRATVEVTEELVRIVASRYSDKAVELLLNQGDAELRVTEAVVEAAAGNIGSGKEVMELLLDNRGAEVKVTEAVVKAAAGNTGSGNEVMKLLLDKQGAEVKITEAVVKAATGNIESGKEVIELLLDKRGAEVKITEAVVKAAAGNKEVIELLLDKRGAEVKVTEAVVKAAAGNRWQGKEVMELLLDGRATVEVTEELVRIVAS